MRQKDTKLIIIDGMDNTGKTTLINRITSVLQDQLDMNVNIIHLEKPPKEIKLEDLRNYIEEKIEFQKLYNFFLSKKMSVFLVKFIDLIIDTSLLMC